MAAGALPELIGGGRGCALPNLHLDRCILLTLAVKRLRRLLNVLFVLALALRVRFWGRPTIKINRRPKGPQCVGMDQNGRVEYKILDAVA